MLPIKILGLLIIYSLACASGGALAARYLGGRGFLRERIGPTMALATAFILGAGIISSILHIPALAGWFNRPLIALLLGLITILGLKPLRRLASGVRGELIGFWREIASAGLFWWFLALVLVLILISPVATVGRVIQGDATCFHMTLPRVLAATGELLLLPKLDIYYPFGLQAEMHFAAIQSLAGVDTAGGDAAQLFCWPNLVATVVVLMGFCHKTGAGIRGQLIAVIILITSTDIMRWMGQGKIDIYSLALGLSAYYWAVRRRSVWLSGLLAGFSIVAKTSYALVLGPGLIYLVAWKHLKTNGIQTREWKELVKEAAKPVLSLGWWTLLGLSPLFIKNWIQLGTPISIYSRTGDFMGWDTKWLHYTPKTWSYPLNMSFLASGGNISPLILAFLPLTLLLPRPASWSGSTLFTISLIGAGGLLIYWLLFPAVICPRYFKPAYVLLAIPAARAAEAVLTKGDGSWLLPGGVTLTLLICLVTATSFYFNRGTFLPEESFRYLSGRITENDIEGPPLRSQRAINREAEPGDRILLNHFSLYWLRPDLIQSAFGMGTSGVMGVKPERSVYAWSMVRSQGLRFIYFDDRYHGSIDFPPLPTWVKLKTIYREGHYTVLKVEYHDPPLEQKSGSVEVRPGIWRVERINK